MKRKLVSMLSLLMGCAQPTMQLIPTKAENVIEVERTVTGFRGHVGIAAEHFDWAVCGKYPATSRFVAADSPCLCTARAP